MDIEWRTVQLFLDPEGVVEVQIDHENHSKLRCNCDAFNTYARCKHVKYVRDEMRKNDGHYSIEVNEDVPDEEAITAMLSAESFRNFVVRHAKIKVLE